MSQKSIIITGAGSGIGKSTAQAFLDAGWSVGLVGRREAPLAEAAGGVVPPASVAEPLAEALFLLNENQRLVFVLAVWLAVLSFLLDPPSSYLLLL